MPEAAETPLALARKAAEFLAGHGIENARLESELLLASVLGISRLDLYLQFERPLTEAEVEAFRGRVRRRLRREPLQYILGEAHFRDLVLAVDRRVLVPRPETEVLVGEVLAWATSREAGGGEGGGSGEGEGQGGGEGLTALDIGVGSGAIALSLAYEGPFERIVATDVSEGALEVAAENARRLGLEGRVEFRRGTLWHPLVEGERFDVVVSNPPYLAESEYSTLQPEVRDWEPAAALMAGERGLDALMVLVAGAPAHLREGGLLALEVGYDQAGEVADEARRAGFAEVRTVRDLAGRERVVLAVAGALA